MPKLQTALEDLTPLLKEEAKNIGISLVLLKAIVLVESSANPKACRYEKHFTYHTDVELHAKKLGITQDTERVFQKTSWGLMQIMGGTARFLGFKEPLTDLLEPEVGLRWGCEYFKQNCLDYENVADQISAYNAGVVRKNSLDGTYRNQAYVEKVLNTMSRLMAPGPLALPLH